MASKDKTEQKELSLEEAFGELEKTVAVLESEDITLEESFQAYRVGMSTLKYCNEKIDRVEKQVLKINEAGELHEF